MLAHPSTLLIPNSAFRIPNSHVTFLLSFSFLVAFHLISSCLCTFGYIVCKPCLFPKNVVYYCIVGFCTRFSPTDYPTEEDIHAYDFF